MQRYKERNKCKESEIDGLLRIEIGIYFSGRNPTQDEINTTHRNEEWRSLMHKIAYLRLDFSSKQYSSTRNLSLGVSEKTNQRNQIIGSKRRYQNPLTMSPARDKHNFFGSISMNVSQLLGKFYVQPKTYSQILLSLANTCQLG